MSLELNDRKITRRLFAQQGSLAFAAGMISPLTLAGSRQVPPEKLAMYQESSARGVICNLCPNECNIKDGDAGDCRSRIARNSKLYSIAFANPCAANADPVEKKPLYHFLPGSAAFSIATAGCNLACLNCQNWTISQTSPGKTDNYDMPPADVVKYAMANACKSIAYTYSEPVTFYEYVYETAQKAREKGIKNIMVSNGYIKTEPLKELCRYIDGANIDLKSFRDSTYLKLTGGRLQPVLDTLKTYRDKGVWLEITNLVVPEWTDKEEEIKEMCEWLVANGFKETPLHFSRFQPQYKLVHLPPTPVPVLSNAAAIARKAGMNHVYIGNVPGSGSSDTICPSCKEKVIERNGYRITANRLKEGHCSCGTVIPGIWK